MLDPPLWTKFKYEQIFLGLAFLRQPLMCGYILYYSLVNSTVYRAVYRTVYSTSVQLSFQYIIGVQTVIGFTASYRICLLRRFFFVAKFNSFLQTIPPSLKTDCPAKRKPILTRSICGDGLCKPLVPKLHVYHAGDGWVRTRLVWCTNLFVLTEL